MQETTFDDATVEEPAAAAETENPNVTEGREARLDKLAKNHILAAMGVGLIPIPLVDLVAVTGIQLDLIKKIAAEYEVPFKQEKVKFIVSSLVGGFFSMGSGIVLSSLVKCIPVIGQTTGAVAMPVISGAATYAIYKVFVRHFESGGTIVDLDPKKVKDYFAEQFTKGKKAAADLKAEEPASSDA